MSFVRPQLHPISDLAAVIDNLYRPHVDYHLAAITHTAPLPQAPPADLRRRPGRQRRRSSRTTRAKSGDDDGEPDGGDDGGTVVTDLSVLPALLTADDVACLLRTSRAAIYGMAGRGRLPGVTRVGRRLLVRRDVLLRSLFEGRAPSPRGTRR